MIQDKALEWKDFLPPEFSTNDTCGEPIVDTHDWWSPCEQFQATLVFWTPAWRYNHDEFTITFYDGDEGAFDLVGHGVNFCGVDAMIDNDCNAKFKVKDLQAAKRAGRKVELRVEW